MVHHNVVYVIVSVIANMLRTWLRRCVNAFHRSDVYTTLVACCGRGRDVCGRMPAPAQPAEQPVAQRAIPSDVEASRERDANVAPEFVVVEFNAWECAGLEILWAAVTSKIFDAVRFRLDVSS